MQVWNLWGGLIYLIAPRGARVDGAEVTVQVAVPAPYYKSGECVPPVCRCSSGWVGPGRKRAFIPPGVTTAGEWARLRTAPSPWAEMEFDNIVVTVPSDAVRDLERPDELAALWNAIMGAIVDLAALPPKLGRKERIVTDVQISHGWCPRRFTCTLLSRTHLSRGGWPRRLDARRLPHHGVHGGGARAGQR